MNALNTAMMVLGYMTAVGLIAGCLWIFARKYGGWEGIR